MKDLALCILLLVVCAAAQTETKPAASNGAPPDTIPGINKKITDLKVSDLPKSGDDPLSLETTFKCATLGQLAVDNEQKNGAITELVRRDVLEAVPTAASWCLVRDVQSLPDAVRDDALRQIAALLDVTAELEQRRYNSLVEKYNALLTVARDLQQQLFTAQIKTAQQERIRDVLAIYILMPKYTPSKTLNINVTDCTRYPALCAH